MHAPAANAARAVIHPAAACMALTPPAAQTLEATAGPGDPGPRQSGPCRPDQLAWLPCGHLRPLLAGSAYATSLSHPVVSCSCPIQSGRARHATKETNAQDITGQMPLQWANGWPSSNVSGLSDCEWHRVTIDGHHHDLARLSSCLH